MISHLSLFAVIFQRVCSSEAQLAPQVTLGYPRFSVIVTLIISWLLADVLSGPMGTARMQLPENWDSAAC